MPIAQQFDERRGPVIGGGFALGLAGGTTMRPPRLASGALLIGGGVPKNFILQSMLMTPNGFDYAVQLTGDRPDLGGLSGATLDEARSWGKITEEAQAVTVYGDATITFPVLIAAALERIRHD